MVSSARWADAEQHNNTWHNAALCWLNVVTVLPAQRAAAHKRAHQLRLQIQTKKYKQGCEVNITCRAANHSIAQQACCNAVCGCELAAPLAAAASAIIVRTSSK
jgi:hypothetical protein